VSDDLIFAAAESLLDCVRVALDATPDQAPSRAYVSMGEPAWDDCCSGPQAGQLVVWWSRVYESSDFPDADDRPVVCQSGFTAVEFQVEVVRCAPGGDENGNPPTADVLHASAAQANVDARAVWRGVQCCRQEHRYDWSSIIAGQVPTGPQGGCVGSRLTLTIGLIDGCGCY
jgi:hypothetical protein